MTEVIGIDHIYITVSDLKRAESFYDIVMEILGFKKNRLALAGEEHIQYFNRHFAYVLRPARAATPYNAYAPGLHHFCFRVDQVSDVIEVANKLKTNSIQPSDPKYYPEYAPDYYAIYFADPDGIMLEVTNYRDERRKRHDQWDDIAP